VRTSKDREEERREEVRRLEDENKEIVAQLARLKAKHLKNEAYILRSRSPLPSKDACPQCWYDHGNHHQMKPQPSAEHRIDAYRCGECGYTETRKV